VRYGLEIIAHWFAVVHAIEQRQDNGGAAAEVEVLLQSYRTVEGADLGATIFLEYS